MAKVERNSSHELLRIFAMFMIVWYHLVSYLMYEIPNTIHMEGWETFLPIMHIGVVLFMLISGYYGIKPSVNGFLRIFLLTMIYYLPVEIVRCVHHNGDLVDTLMFITNIPYWFIRTYLFFYVLSPIVNKFISTSSEKELNYMLLTLGVIACYFGLTGGDASLEHGKNVVNFTFIYLVGNAIRRYEPKWKDINGWLLFGALLAINVVIVALLWYYPRTTQLGYQVWQLSFPYCSPLLIINASLVFMLFTKMHFSSSCINTIASSVFAVYLIHSHPAFRKYIMSPICNYVSEQYDHQEPLMLLIFAAIAIVIMVGSIGIDKCLSPIWRVIRLIK